LEAPLAFDAFFFEAGLEAGFLDFFLVGVMARDADSPASRPEFSGAYT
jgi:hypothetical protein